MSKPDKSITKLTNLKVNEISLCRKGMNPESNVTLFKASDKEVISKSMYTDALASMELRDEIYEFMEPIYDFNSAMRDSISQILENASIVDKIPAIRQIIVEYMQSLKNLFNPVIGDNSAEKSCKDKKETLTEDVKMADDNKDVKKEVVEESIEVNGTTITKSVAGDGVFEIMKALQAETKVIKDALVKAQEEASVEKAKREEAEFITKAEALFPSIPLDIEKKGKLLHEVTTKLSKESQDACMEVFKCAETLSADLVKEEKGSTSNSDTSSDMMARYDMLAKNYAAENHVSLSKARLEVMKTDEGKDLLKN